MGTRQLDLLKAPAETKTPVAMYIRVLMVGLYFGIVLVKTEVVRWQRINSMFLFEEPYMYLVMGSAVVVGGVGMFLIRRFNIKTVDKEPIAYQPKLFHKGVIIGGVIFGMGWAITGACPGPIYAQIGGGEWLGFVTFLGALGGMYLYAFMRHRLPHW
jgi:uncharacterized membrane protein YedE/YeeE